MVQHEANSDRSVRRRGDRVVLKGKDERMEWSVLTGLAAHSHTQLHTRKGRAFICGQSCKDTNFLIWGKKNKVSFYINTIMAHGIAGKQQRYYLSL